MSATCPRRLDRFTGFALVGELGRGGMGIVFEAQNRITGARHAIKMVTSHSPDACERTVREAKAASMLKSPHATRIDAFGVTPDGLPYIVMERLHGLDLAAYAEQAGGRVPLETAITLVLQACSVVGEAHGWGIVHRDLKPANIFVTRRPDGSPHVKLLDFGIAKMPTSAEPSRTCSGLVFGTPLYMSPEQLKSSTNVGPTADVWSLGVILYQLIFGVPPFDGENVSQVIASILSDAPSLARDGVRVPGEVRRVLRKCLAKDPAARYRDAHALGAELARLELGRHDVSSITPRPWAVPLAETRVLEDASSAPWGRVEWTAAIVCCVVMLVAGVLTSSLGGGTRAAASAPPAEAPLPAPSSSVQAR